jgi:hypothetical protein
MKIGVGPKKFKIDPSKQFSPSTRMSVFSPLSPGEASTTQNQSGFRNIFSADHNSLIKKEFSIFSKEFKSFEHSENMPTRRTDAETRRFMARFDEIA